MSKKSEAVMTGAEFARYLDKSGILVSLRDDGTTWGISLHSNKWRRYRVKKPDITLDTWIANKRAKVAALESWQRGVRSLPSIRTLERWSYDSVCKTVTGDTIEPDGIGADGAPSWLIVLGMI